jgi:hypothetical protein
MAQLPRILEYRRVPPTKQTARPPYFAAGVTVVVGIVLLALLLNLLMYLAIAVR